MNPILVVAVLTNLLANPSFEMVEPPPPNAKTASQQAIDPASFVPRTWDVYARNGALISCPADKAQAHSGNRCIYMQAIKGTAGVINRNLVVPADATWTIALWARGQGNLNIRMDSVLADKIEAGAVKTVKMSEHWEKYEFEVPMQAGIASLNIYVENSGSVWLDDVLVSYPGLKELGLPTTKKLSKDDGTLLYLPFEQWFDEDVFFVKQKVELSKEGEGVFGKCLKVGAEGYVACSANESMEASRGTIEAWVRFQTAGNDQQSKPVISVPGPNGMWMGRNQYGHVGIYFSSGWKTQCGAQATGYANHWQPGTWRHLAACWDKDMIQVFVDGKMIAWCYEPVLVRMLGSELSIGAQNMDIDELRISNFVRYRQPMPPKNKMPSSK